MSIIDKDGNPVAYDWNEIAVHEKLKLNSALQAIPDDEFERLFPYLFDKPPSESG
jgi:hypothetical protein